MPLFGKRNVEPPSSPLPNGPSSVRQGSYDGRPMIVGLNDGLAPFAGDRLYPVRAAIAVQARQIDESGFPSSDDLERLGAFEDEFTSRFCAPGLAALAAVITTGGMREFVFYASDEPAFRASFNDWARTPKSHRIQMMLARDPKWSVYQTLAQTAA